MAGTPDWVTVFDGTVVDAEVAAAALRAAGVHAETTFAAGPGGGGLWWSPSAGLSAVLVPRKQRSRALEVLGVKERRHAPGPEARQRRPAWRLAFVAAAAVALAATLLGYLKTLG